MTLSQLITYVNGLKPNTFSNDVKTGWVNEIEGTIQTEVLGIHPDDIVQYTYSTDQSKTLLVDAPYSKLYAPYIMAMVDFANGEYTEYTNSMDLFNGFYEEYIHWFRRTHKPGTSFCEATYISAYGIAVKHGYQGTETEWLASLKGETGATGATGAAIVSTVLQGQDAQGGNIYLQTFDNGSTANFTAPKGAKGDTGNTGASGTDGYSPIATVNKVGSTATITITDKNGTTTSQVSDGSQGSAGQDGFSPIANVSKSGSTATITITDSVSTTTASVSDGLNGADGEDGFSPSLTTNKVGKVTTVTVTQKSGTSTFTINDGADGQGSGDMLKSVYDADGDGVVDNSEALDGHAAAYFATSSSVTSHTSDSTIHVTSSDKSTWNNKVDKNNPITGATKTKITYDSKGLVTAGADLTASDIPSLSASKITSGTFADSRIASASTWNGKSAKATTYTGTLTANGWSNNTQTLTISGLETSGYAYTVAPASASFSAYTEAVIYADDIVTQNQIVFHCSNVPSSAISVVILKVQVA